MNERDFLDKKYRSNGNLRHDQTKHHWGPAITNSRYYQQPKMADTDLGPEKYSLFI